MIGGGFGRRGQPDFVVDSVLLSKIVGGGTPVKVIHSREDDVAAGRMQPMAAHKIDVGLDKDGKIVGWKHRVVGGSAIGYTNPARLKKSSGKDVLVMAGSEVPNYGIPNWMAQHVHEKRGARLSAWRGIGVGYTEFASEATLDKLAVAANADPVSFRMADVPNVEVKVMPQGGYTPCDRRDGIATDGGRGGGYEGQPNKPVRFWEEAFKMRSAAEKSGARFLIIFRAYQAPVRRAAGFAGRGSRQVLSSCPRPDKVPCGPVP